MMQACRWIRTIVKYVAVGSAVGALLLSSVVCADHNSPDQISKGSSENKLANIVIMKSRLSDVVKMYGRPSRVDSDDYYWERPGWTMMLIFETEDEPVIAIDIRGKKVPTKMGVTGSGLKIGDSLSALRRIYGSKYSERNLPKIGIHDVMIEWQDGVSLVAEIDGSGKIKSLALSAPE